MLIDCETCSVRGDACRDCVVTVILNNPAPTIELDENEQHAFGNLAAVGLVPPLRLVPEHSRDDWGLRDDHHIPVLEAGAPHLRFRAAGP